MPGSVSKTTSPPFPPSPPEGPPNGTNFSRRNATQPLPPRPATIRNSQLSTNLTRGSYHLIVGILRLLPFGFGLGSLALIGLACATNNGECFADDLPDSNSQDSNCDGIDGNAATAIFVATTGSDLGDGTMDKPLRSITAALAMALKQKQ